MSVEPTPEQLEQLWKLIEEESKRRGYKFERTDGEARLIRPDGSVAIIARRKAAVKQQGGRKND